METISKTACSQIIEVLEHIENNAFSKIPVDLRNFLYANREMTYIPNIDYTKDDWKDDLEEDAKVMLALIYRDYLVSKEERQILIKQEEANKIKEFRRRIETEQTASPILSESISHKTDFPIEQKEPWYKKIIQFFKNWFKKES